MCNAHTTTQVQGEVVLSHLKTVKIQTGERHMYKQNAPIYTSCLIYFLFASKAPVWPIQEAFDLCEVKSHSRVNYNWG